MNNYKFELSYIDNDNIEFDVLYKNDVSSFSYDIKKDLIYFYDIQDELAYDLDKTYKKFILMNIRKAIDNYIGV
jgi:hypothetical protein